MPPAARARHEPAPDRAVGSWAASGVLAGPAIRHWGDRARKPSVVVAIPAKNEEEVLGASLRHLGAAMHSSRRDCGLVVFANNCTDSTCDVVARAADGLSGRVVLIEGRLAPAEAHAGFARRIAMDAAAELCDPGGAILTTDADTHVASDWIETCCAALDAGFELVCGRVAMNAQPEILARAPALRLARAETAYADLQDRVRHCCDQLIGRQPIGGRRPHYVEAGANLGLTRALYRRIGGLPPVPSSEDRALVRAGERAGARILYTSRSRVDTSNRLCGRAGGGLAEALRHRSIDADPGSDQRLRPLAGIAAMWSNTLAVSGITGTFAPCSLFGRRAWPDARRLLPAVRHALWERDWLRSLAEPRMVAADLEREITGLAGFLHEEVEPVFAAWREARG